MSAHSSNLSHKPPVLVEDKAVYTAKRRMALVTIWVPTIGTIVAIGLAIIHGLQLVNIGLLFLMYVVTTFGVEVGFHRFFSHGAFKTSKFMTAILGITASMAAQGGILYWVASHRRHHIHSDTPEDPHSPHFRTSKKKGPQRLSTIKGLWHSQMGNMYTDYPTNCTLFAKDILKDKLLSKINSLYPFWVLLGLGIPAAIGGLIAGTWVGVLNGFLWGGLVRIFVVHHIYFANGSFSHMYGARPFDNGDFSANNLWFGIPTFGSAYQNNHHAFPTSAVLGLKWWEMDVGAIFIRLFEILGIFWDVKRVSQQQIQQKLRT